ncbi:MAG: hypothetical protein JJU00_17365 [Opitutales bacterium]|nr:hypothetical protein [Opitutales bacterium]
MRSRVAYFLAFTVLAPTAWTQLFFDNDLLWLRPLDFLDPDFANQAPIDAYTFDRAIQGTNHALGSPPIDVYGSLIFYADGMTILNVGQRSNPDYPDYDFSGRLHQVGLYKANDGTAKLADGNPFSMYFDGVEQSPATGWSLADNVNNFVPQGIDYSPRDKDEFIHFRGPNGNRPLVIPSDEIATFVFWFDPATFASGEQYSFEDVPGWLTPDDDGFPPDLAFRWQGLEPEAGLNGGSDSYAAIARLQPYGGVIPVPEPATYLGASVLLLFVGGHFLHMRRRKKNAAK